MRRLAKFHRKSLKDYIRGNGLEFELPDMEICLTDGVYPAKLDSLLLAKELVEAVKEDDKVLDIGTGSGILAVLAAAQGAVVTATDVDRESIECARYNALLKGVSLDLRLGDLFEPIGEDSFDIIVCNPPSLPSPPNEQYDEYTARSIDAGWDGRKYIDPLIKQSIKYLRNNGRLLMVHSNFADVGKTKEKLESLGFEVDVKEYDFPIGETSGRRVNYFLENLPQHCHPFLKKRKWYQRIGVFRATLR